MALTREAIVVAAVEILDDYGLADLTMRRLASALDVKAGALYWHFGNKQSLLAAVADDVLAGFVEPGHGDGVGEWLGAWAAELRRILLLRRDAAELVASVSAMDLVGLDPRTSGRLLLRAAGAEPHQADAVMQAFWHFVLGHVVEEQTRAQLARLGVMQPSEASVADRHFEVGVGLLVSGLAAMSIPGQTAPNWGPCSL